MRIGIVVDSACDLPPDFFSENKVEVLPISIQIDKQRFSDTRDTQATLDFYKNQMGSAGHAAETAPYSVEQVKQVFLEKVTIEWHTELLQISSQVLHGLLVPRRSRRVELGPALALRKVPVHVDSAVDVL